MKSTELTTVVEDIKVKSIGKRRWDKSFSPLQLGKTWFYNQIDNLSTKQGYETKELRDQLGLPKSKNKLGNNFHAHCVDSWVLANSVVGGYIIDNKQILCICPIILHKRQLHVLRPHNNGKRKPYGGTISLGFKRGCLVKHPKYGVVYVGGTSNNRISLHSVKSGLRLTQNARVEDCKFLAYNRVRSFIL